MKLGYARVSTNEQELGLQLRALKKSGCTRIYEEKASGASTDRSVLGDLLAHARKGDVVVVWKLDRLGRSLPHLIATIEDLGERQIGFRSLTEAIDTTTSSGKLLFHIMGALATFERDLIRERTRAGLSAARAAGRIGGRRRLLNPEMIETIQTLAANPKLTKPMIAAKLKISVASLYRGLSPNRAIVSNARRHRP